VLLHSSMFGAVIGQIQGELNSYRDSKYKVELAPFFFLEPK